MKLIGEHKARKGLIRIEIEEEDGIARKVLITGDFFVYPEEAIFQLENEMEGKPVSELEGIIEDFFSRRHDVETPYVNVEDFKLALKKALEGKK
ncbi:MAG: lipoate---protein ligase [Pyrococcus sp.]|uniref:lipoate--protein ligase family protein n=1 Tax=Pyrococcus sp. TaxID=33866 RepID=UPI00258F0D64|nr:lipoate--protein ligase family protein [Pyrococcus sp.]MDK2869452.1 lipoate---protein ligase [Pyrococcus sp.]